MKCSSAYKCAITGVYSCTGPQRDAHGVTTAYLCMAPTAFLRTASISCLKSFQHLQQHKQTRDYQNFSLNGKDSCVMLTSPMTAGIISSVTILFTAESAAVISNTFVLKQSITPVSQVYHGNSRGRSNTNLFMSR
jgi:hypothetical protein